MGRDKTFCGVLLLQLAVEGRQERKWGELHMSDRDRHRPTQSPTMPLWKLELSVKFTACLPLPLPFPPLARFGSSS